MLKIYGHPMSTCTRKVLMTLAETNTPFAFSMVDIMKGDGKTEANLARQPFGRVPALDDEGFELFESRAMCRYVNQKANGALEPKDAKARAKMEQWISVETSEFTPHVMKFIYHHIFQRAQDQAVLDAATKGLETTCTVLERQLAKTPFLVGAELTLADVMFMPYLEYGMTTPVKDIVAKHPHVMAWWNRLHERPTWKKATTQAA